MSTTQSNTTAYFTRHHCQQTCVIALAGRPSHHIRSFIVAHHPQYAAQTKTTPFHLATVVKFANHRIYQSPLKHLESLSIKYLTNMYNTAPNTNTILAQATDPNYFYRPLPKH